MNQEPATPADPRPHVVIVGAGFAGLYAAQGLSRAPVRVTVIDRRNHHVFQPLLYQVATAGLNPSDIAAPVRRVLRKQQNATVVLGEVVAIDVPGKRLRMRDGELGYDILIVATGATHAYFGHDDWAPLAPGLKSIEDALEIRRRVLLAFEAAERETDPVRRRALLTFAVVGGGPTGVELAGALSELARQSLARDFRHIDPRQARVVLIEAADRLLGAFSVESGASAKRQLERLGVEVMTFAKVTAIDAEGVSLAGERLWARTVLWAAGVAASPLARTLGAPLDRAGRVRVRPDLTPDFPGGPRDDVFILGDLVALEQDGKPLPGVAPAAIQMGQYIAHEIRSKVSGEKRWPFRYWDKGSLATIGRAAAVADLGSWHLSGYVAWMAWLLIHIVYLIGFRSRIIVLIQWSWAYFTYDRGARLITGEVPTLGGHGGGWPPATGGQGGGWPPATGGHGGGWPPATGAEAPRR